MVVFLFIFHGLAHRQTQTTDTNPPEKVKIKEQLAVVTDCGWMIDKCSRYTCPNPNKFPSDMSLGAIQKYEAHIEQFDPA
jgi:hypothetical protein